MRLNSAARCPIQDILPAAQARVALPMDEVDKVFAAPFRNDFFGMLRSWHSFAPARICG
jgi:AAA-like domain